MVDRQSVDQTEAGLDRVYARVKLACVVAILLLVAGAVIKAIPGISFVVSHGLILLALMVMAGSAVHVVLRTDYSPRAAPALLAGGALILCSQALAATGMFPAFSDWPVFGARGLGHQAVRQISGWTGLGLLIASFYLSLAEAVIARTRMAHQQRQLQKTSEELATARDDLERRVRERTAELTKAVEDLRQSEERFSQVAASAGDWIWELDADGRYTFCSQGVEQALGRMPEDVLGRDYREFESEHGPSLATWIEAGQAFTDAETQAVHANGKRLHHRCSGFPILAADGKRIGFRGTSRDITSQKQLEEQIQEVRRLESLAQLAGGVAHDFNNLITIIMGCCEQLRSMLSEDDESLHVVEVIRETAEQATSVTRSLLHFGQQQPGAGELRALDLNAAISQTCRLLHRLLPARVELVIETGDAPLWVNADSQLPQILINLAVNARDAMPSGGPLVIGSVIADNGKAELFVRDQGEGMDEEVRERIFEPFFTTKPRGQGTGLGMAIVHSIVREYGGAIEVESAVGQGTTIRIQLPPVAGPEPEEEHEDVHPVGRGQNALVLEGNPLVRGLLTSQLRALGFEVTGTGNIEQFEREIEESRADLRLLILDIDQLDGDGQELLARIRKTAEDCPAIVISAQANDDTILGGDAATRSLTKPFDAQQLAQLVNEILQDSLLLNKQRS